MARQRPVDGVPRRSYFVIRLRRRAITVRQKKKTVKGLCEASRWVKGTQRMDSEYVVSDPWKKEEGVLVH